MSIYKKEAYVQNDKFNILQGWECMWGSKEDRLGVEALATVIINFDTDGIEEYDALVAPLKWNEYCLKPKKFELNLMRG